MSKIAGVAVVAAVVAALVSLLLAQPSKWNGGGGASIIGEEPVPDASAAVDLAERMVREAGAIWAQPSSDWATVPSWLSGGVSTEARRIDGGDYAESGVLLTRASGVIRNASADATIRHLVSPSGFAIIDPFSDPADFGKVIEAFAWRGNKRLEVGDARADLPGFAPRVFSVLNAVDVDARIFASKSILHSSKPGGSEFNTFKAQTPVDGSVRALNTFAVRTTPLGKDCVVDMVNFAHLGGRFPRAVTNLINGNFLDGVFQRLQKAMDASEA
ncbi:hypothetical protein M885DRAFT_433895 [Pelagophyceae sp. CCMP2097]|nr:hypothetical protein M885DRAFT_433895 [Pelagophyceae sp. CCMP2097]